MTFQVDAIYDGGVLRPLEPLAIPDQSRVHVVVSSDRDDDSSPTVLAAQQAALDKLRKIVDAMPQEPNNDGWSVKDHDQLLYGNP